MCSHSLAPHLSSVKGQHKTHWPLEATLSCQWSPICGSVNKHWEWSSQCKRKQRRYRSQSYRKPLIAENIHLIFYCVHYSTTTRWYIPSMCICSSYGTYCMKVHHVCVHWRTEMGVFAASWVSSMSIKVDSYCASIDTKYLLMYYEVLMGFIYPLFVNFQPSNCKWKSANFDRQVDSKTPVNMHDWNSIFQ